MEDKSWAVQMCFFINFEIWFPSSKKHFSQNMKTEYTKDFIFSKIIYITVMINEPCHEKICLMPVCDQSDQRLCCSCLDSKYSC